VFQKYGINEEAVWDISLERMPNVNGEDWIGKTVRLSYSQDLVDLPTKGNGIGQVYLTDIKEGE
jgi:hypothetical protein